MILYCHRVASDYCANIKIMSRHHNHLQLQLVQCHDQTQRGQYITSRYKEESVNIVLCVVPCPPVSCCPVF